MHLNFHIITKESHSLVYLVMTDIYSAWIAPAYKTKLVVQSWLNGPNPYPSNCTIADYSVFNILNKRLVGEAFSTHNDHSKWAASTTQSLVCISDLNRMVKNKFPTKNYMELACM